VFINCDIQFSNQLMPLTIFNNRPIVLIIEQPVSFKIKDPGWNSNPMWLTPTASMSPLPLPLSRPPLIPRIGKTPHKSGLSSAQASPYMMPDRVTTSDGSPMVLFTPKQHMAQKEAQQHQPSNGTCSPWGRWARPMQPRLHI
jgi:hypothetical protein